MRRSLVLAAALVAALAVAGVATAAPPKQPLAQALKASGVASHAQGAVVVDLRTGKLVYAKNAERPLRPASNEKLPVSIAALHRLGPGYRFETRVLGAGRRAGSTWRGNLVLKGSGDPTLRTRDLAALARQVRALGIRRVEGRVIADATRFDSVRAGAGWRAGFTKVYCAPLSALIVNGGIQDGRFSDRPEVTAGVLFRRALAARGVTVTGPNGVGKARRGATPLASVRSEPLSRLVERVNRYSDNFVAEMLLKELGARATGTGSGATGAGAVVAALEDLGVPLRGVRIVDGSGLSTRNRLTAQALARLLVAARQDERLAPALTRSLAVAGRTGTLAWRMNGTAAHGSVLAKTGTTRQASSLSGYVGSRYAFSILMNGEPVPQWSARAGQDRFAAALARSLG